MAHRDYVNVGDPLDRLVEEASEVIKAVSKMRRFGIWNYHPDDPHKTPNFVFLFREMDDLRLAMDAVQDILPPN